MPIQKVIGLDVGGTTVRGVFYDISEEAIEAVVEKPTETNSLASFVSQLELFVEELQNESEKEAEAIGVGVPSFLDYDRGRVLGSTNFDLLADMALSQTLSDRLGLPVRMENDANCAALAEATLGVGRNKSIVVALTIGTGMGSGIVIDGSILKGAHGGAGEIGYVMTPEMGEKVGEKEHPSTLEWHASGAFLRHLFKGKNPADVEQKARDGDADAAEAYVLLGRYVGVAISALANIVDPSIVTIAGGVGHAWDLMKESTLAVVQESVGSPSAREGLIVVPAALGADAGAVGAVLLWKE